jgi:tetratricopeptide (TPR) repeat protein
VLWIGLWIGGMASDASAQVPTEAEVYIDRAIVAYEGKRYADALKELQEALALDPQSVEAHYYLGLVYIALDRYPEAQAALEKARAIRPTDLNVTFQLGVLHFSRQEYGEAEPLLREVFRAEPRRQNLGYYLGFMEYRRKNYREALEFLRANVPSDATFAQLSKFYTGLALSALGFPGEARAEVEEAIRLQPLSSLASPAERFREGLEPAAKLERRFRGELRVGGFYDDNVTVIPNPSSDVVAQEIRQGQRDRESDGEVVALRLAYTWLRTVDWEATVSYAFLQTFNNRVGGFHVQSHIGGVGLTYRGTVRGMPYFMGIQFTYDYITVGEDPFLGRPILQPFFTLVENPGNLTTFQLRTQFKDFASDDTVVPEEDRDATNYLAGVTHFFRFAEDRHYIKVGYQYDYENAQGLNWSYSGNRILVGGQYTLPWGDIRLRYDLDVHLRQHRDRHSLLPVGQPNTIRRRDRELLHLFSIAKDLPYDLTVSLEYLFDDNRSNLDAFDFDRNVVSLSLTWQF